MFGMVKWFDTKKGFGFITAEGVDSDIFAHYSAIVGEGYRVLKDNDPVEFDLEKTSKGLSAKNIKTKK